MVKKKKCNKCKKYKDINLFNKSKYSKDGRNIYCAKCKSIYKQANIEKIREKDIIYQRKRRLENPEMKRREYYKYKKKNPERVTANWMLRYAVKKGKIVKGKCEICGSKIVHAHHDDYSKPLEVRWLCPLHHKKEHTKKLK